MNSMSGKFEVKVGKKKHTCNLSMNAFRLLCERENMTFSAMDKFLTESPLSAVPKVIYYGMMNDVYVNSGDLKKLPEFEFFCSQILQSPEQLEEYSTMIAKAFNGESTEEGGNE